MGSVVIYSGPFWKWTKEELRQGFTSEKRQADYMCQEKKEEEDSPTLNIECMHQYGNTKTTLERERERERERKKRPITVASGSIENMRTNRNTITKKQKWVEKQLYGYFQRQIGHGYGKETLGEKLNLF